MPGDVFGQFDDGDVWALDLRTGTETRFIENAFNPAFSPDGAHIAVDASWAGPRRIWMLDREGHNPQQVTTDTSEARAHLRPRWSPEGKRIVFQNLERTKFDIRAVDLASTISFSHDHSRIMDVVGHRVLWVTPLGGKPVKVYEFPDPTVRIDYPVWSPDGKWVLFDRFLPQGGDVWMMENFE